MREELFEPFSQQDRSPARATAGLGLSLPIARTIIELHGGRIAAHSDGPRHGANLTIELPAIQRGTHPTHSGDERPGPLTPGHQSVLPNRGPRRCRDRLSGAPAPDRASYQVRTNRSRRDRARHTRPPDVILCDIGLPDIDGHEVARRLRAAPRTAHILLIAISGYGHAEDSTRSHHAGFNRHLVKPLSSRSLARALIETTQPDT